MQHSRAVTGLACFPVEIHHHIFALADPEDVLALRKTCKYFLALTQDPRLWTSVYGRMRNTHPLGYSQDEFVALTTSQAERLLVRASKTEKLFRTFRRDIQHRIIPDGQTRRPGPLAALTFLSERYILSADDTTVVYVWDLPKLASCAGAPSFPCARLTLVGWDFVTHGMSTDQSTFYVVLSKDARAHIFALSLPTNVDDARLRFRDVAYVDTRSKKVNSIDPDACLVLLELSHTTIEIIDWRSQVRSRIALDQVGGGAVDNDVLALRICGPYLLCFRRWSIEAYPIPGPFLPPEHGCERVGRVSPLFQPYSSSTMYIALAHVRRSKGVYTLCALVVDRYWGTCHYVVQLQTIPEPTLSLRVLAKGVYDTRITAWDLGATGLRGVWVLGQSSSGDRRVVAFGARPGEGELGGKDVGESPGFNEQVVSVMSAQLSEGYPNCAISEFTGRIALGSWTGEITVF